MFTMKIDGPLRLNIGEDDFSDDLQRKLVDHTPWRTGRGAGSIRVRQIGKGMGLRWRVRLYGYLVAQSYGAEIPDRPIWKANPKPQRWFNGVRWVTKNKTRGYHMTAKRFIQDAVDDFIHNVFVPSIGWASGEGDK